MTYLVKLRRSSVVGEKPVKEYFSNKELAINIADRLIFYVDKENNIKEWDASVLPDEIWDRLVNGIEF